MIECLAGHGCSGIDVGTKVCHFFQGIKIGELEAVINVFLTQPEKYGKNFYATVSFCDQMVTMKGYNMQSIHTDKLEVSQWRLKWQPSLGR